ncbi:hypothetical protein Pan44_41620 [Caulifigura coniformis]|uniref:Uncharacterized protein n=1 Tax=Caulifigura coniformis TaxID=2527983 RepID=A0A517SJ10_9PLAN|nr:hypothetical protein [Caulifigura coniformis]QDT56111.1 hypothetical protein Pan44_41620 [Caulifigura coniformis]
MRFSLIALPVLCLAGCTAGPRASMFDPVGGPAVQLMTPEVDPFLETPAVPVGPGGLRPPTLPKLGPVSSAARHHMWRAAQSLGPAVKSTQSSIPLSARPSQTPGSVSATSPAKHLEAKPTSIQKMDGLRGFVQILPPPPDDVGGSAAAPRESRYFELPPPP